MMGAHALCSVNFTFLLINVLYLLVFFVYYVYIRYNFNRRSVYEENTVEVDQEN